MKSISGMRSLANQLSLCYGLSAFFLVLGSASYLYWSLEKALALQDHQIILEKVRTVMLLMDKFPIDNPVIGSRLSGEWAHRKYERIYARILDENHRVLVGSQYSNIFSSLKNLDNSEALKVTIDESVFRIESTRISTNHSSQVFIVQVALDRTANAKVLDSYKRGLAVIIFSAFLLSLWLGRRLAKRGVKPIEDISNAVRRIGSLNVSERLNSDDLPIEFETLVRTFNEMLARIEDNIERLSRFSEDIAHELRTPVNNLIGEFGVALSKARELPEYQDTLASGVEECDRIARIIDSILFMAQTDNPQNTIDKEKIELETELALIRDFFEEAAITKRVSLVIDIAEPIQIIANRTLLQRAMSNLISNSIKYTPADGRITISAEKASSEVIIKVADTGCGISEEHLKRIFDRFYRVDPSRTASFNSNGLGLAIFKSIVKAHNGHFAVSSQVAQGTTVALTLPL